MRIKFGKNKSISLSCKPARVTQLAALQGRILFKSFAKLRFSRQTLHHHSHTFQPDFQIKNFFYLLSNQYSTVGFGSQLWKNFRNNSTPKLFSFNQSGSYIFCMNKLEFLHKGRNPKMEPIRESCVTAGTLLFCILMNVIHPNKLASFAAHIRTPDTISSLKCVPRLRGKHMQYFSMLLHELFNMKHDNSWWVFWLPLE